MCGTGSTADDKGRCTGEHVDRVPDAKFVFTTSSHAVIIYFGGLGLRVRVKFSLGVRVSGMIRVRVDVEVRVRVRVSNLLGSD